ncbi:MAG: glycosyltransferase family 39 protein [Planctomycetota bacterium]
MKPRIALLLVIAIAFLHAAAITKWLAADARQPRGETARYFIQTSRVADALAAPSPEIFTNIYNAIPEPFPPLLAIVGAPFLYIWPDDVDAAVYSQILFLAIAAFGAYAIGNKLRGPAAGVFAAFLLTTTAHAAIYQHTFLAEMPVLAFSACSLAAFLYSDGFRRTGPSLALGAATGLGILSNWNFVFAAAPAAVFIILTFFHCLLQKSSGQKPGESAAENTPPGSRVFNVILSILAAAAIAWPWWNARGSDVLQYAGTPTFTFSADALYFYMNALAREAAAPFVILCIASAGLLALSLAARGGSRSIVDLTNGRGAIVCITFFLITWIALSLDARRDSRYGGMLLPPLAGIVAYAACGVRLSLLRRPLYLLSAAAGIFTFLGVAFETFASDDLRLRATQLVPIGNIDFRVYQPENPPPPFQPAPGRKTVALTNIKNPPDPTDADPRRALDAVVRDRSDKNLHIYFVTPQEILDGAALEYWCQSRYRNLIPHLVREYYIGPVKDAVFAAFSPYEFLIANYVIVARRRGAPQPWERDTFPMNAGFLQFFEGDAPVVRKHLQRIYMYEPVRDPFERANDIIVEVYKRIQPADAEEIQEVVDGINQFDQAKPGTWVDIAYYWLHSGKTADAKKIVDANVKDPGLLAPVHKDRLQQILSAPDNVK